MSQNEKASQHSTQGLWEAHVPLTNPPSYLDFESTQ